MMRLKSRRLPLWQIVRPLFLDVRLCVNAVLAGELLRNRILDPDVLDGFAEVGQGTAPKFR
jgi:hypothetical protein